MSRSTEIMDLLYQLEKKIVPLEWDANRNQINEFKLKQLKSFQEQKRLLEEELKSFE